MLTDIDGIIFDMDGTLIDSMWVWPGLDDCYMEKYGLRQPEGFHESIEGMSCEEVADYFLESFPNLTCSREEMVEEWIDMAYEAYTTQVTLKKGALNFIRKMKKAGKKIGIATSNAKSLVDDTLHALQVSHLFDVVRTAGEVQAGKPAPDVYLLVAQELGIRPDRCLVFEDVPMGILAGKNAGMRVCAVADDFSLLQLEKKKELADYFIQDFRDIEQETYEILTENLPDGRKHR